MVLAHHLIFGAYGFWLPNDPRGSWSQLAWELVLAGGKATHSTVRRSTAHVTHDVAARLMAKQALAHQAIVFSGAQAVVIATGFSNAAARAGYQIRACSIMPEHMHIVVDRHAHPGERIIGHLKRGASMALYRAKLHPFDGLKRPGGNAVSCWGEKGWDAYLDTRLGILKAIDYVKNNPIKEGKRPQIWSLIKPFV